MSATVLKHHRSLAFSSVWQSPPSKNESEWIATGEGIGGGPLLRGVAQAMADLEAETARRTWGEGYGAGTDDENPYPEIES